MIELNYIGKYGEYIVLSELLRKNIEAYQAIKNNQNDYDITAIINNKKIVRIQVKTTTLENKSTNNSLNINNVYDILIIVIITYNTPNFYILTREEALAAQNFNKKLGIVKIRNKKFFVRDEILLCENRWDKIINISTPSSP